MKLSIKDFLWFCALIVALFFATGMHQYFQLRPQGPHQWRQADCSSFALNFAQQSNSLFEPELHNLMSDGGESGKSAGEFPILYYTVGKIWKITGQYEWIFRLVNLLIFVAGLFALFKITFRYSRSLLTSLFLVGAVFTIPVFTFYAPGFLSNITALSFVFMGWYFAISFYENEKMSRGILAVLCFALAPLLKITALISVLALLGVLGIHLVFGQRIFAKKISTRIYLFSAVGALIVLGTTFVWYAYSRAYNTMHGGWFTFNDLWPIWQVDKTHLEQTFDFVSKVWIYEYFSTAGYLFLTASVFLLFYWRKSIAPFVKWMLLFMLLGNVLYVLLWFKALRDHDYYVINLYALPIFLWISILVEMRKNVAKNSMTKLMGVIVVCGVLIANSVYAFQHLNYRYTGWMNNDGENQHASFFDITPVLRKDFNMTRDTRVVTFPDPSYCITLYLADQKGWPMKPEDNADFLKSRIDLGAKFVLVNDSSFYQIPGIKELNLTKIGQHKTIDILKVTNP